MNAENADALVPLQALIATNPAPEEKTETEMTDVE
jgi:hypothetical protein